MNTSQKAAKNGCLARILPIVFGPSTDLGNPVWENLLLLKEILDYAFAPGLCKVSITRLNDKITDFLTHFMIT